MHLTKWKDLKLKSIPIINAKVKKGQALECFFAKMEQHKMSLVSKLESQNRNVTCKLIILVGEVTILEQLSVDKISKFTRFLFMFLYYW